MITTEFIIRYTNALYATQPEYAPRYDEFRDMFSSGQLASKQWAVRELSKVVDLSKKHMIIVGCWFGTLGMLFKMQNPELTISFLDIDPRCTEYISNLVTFERNAYVITEDMYDHKYFEDIVVNTSCEHIVDVTAWMKKIPTGTIVLLQSNDNEKEDGHINCVTDCRQFEEQAQLSEIFYSDKLVTPMYTRFMLIGIK